MTFYHFTSEHHIPFILREGVLQPTDPNLDMFDSSMEPRVVWLLDQPEATGGNSMHHGLSDIKRRIRIEVDVPAIKWTNWVPARKMDPDWRETLIRVGGGPEAADHWYVLPGPIRANRWRSIVDMATGLELPRDPVAAVDALG